MNRLWVVVRLYQIEPAEWHFCIDKVLTTSNNQTVKCYVDLHCHWMLNSKQKFLFLMFEKQLTAIDMANAIIVNKANFIFELSFASTNSILCFLQTNAPFLYCIFFRMAVHSNRKLHFNVLVCHANMMHQKVFYVLAVNCQCQNIN